ncbi:MAG: hypothetical protein AAGG00_16045 [Cyanobacteria bacterium P01_H01_bin.150]
MNISDKVAATDGETDVATDVKDAADAADAMDEKDNQKASLESRLRKLLKSNYKFYCRVCYRGA